MTAQHSEAPWWATPHGIRNVGGYITHTNNVHRYEGQDERYAHEVAEREADKRLIAAAPDLLKALSDLLDVASVRIDDPRIEQWTAARAAITKATGKEA